MASLIPGDAVARAKEAFLKPVNWGVSMEGCFLNVTQERWDDACERMVEIKSVMLERNAILEAPLDDVVWVAPLLAEMDPMHLSHLPIVDVGSGPSCFIWDAYLRGIKETLGIDMFCFKGQLPEEAKAVQCQILDLPATRSTLSSVSFPPGGLMVCTEMLEHVEYNPLAGMLLIVETLKPSRLYVTVPTYVHQDSKVRGWMHYSEMDGYRGQRMLISPWHYKGWAIEELIEFCLELGFTRDGIFAGYNRLGFLGTSVRKS